MNLDRIVNLLPLGAVLLIALGVLKTSVYYNYFGVDIMSYLTTSEVLTLFLNDYVSILILISLGFVHFIMSNEFVRKIELTVGIEFFENFLRRNKWKYFTVFLLSSIVIIILITISVINLSDGIIYLVAFLSIQTIFFLFVKKKGEEFIALEQLVIFLVSGVIIGIIPLMSLKDIQQININGGKQITLFLKDEIISTNCHNTYLGKAGEYYFFHSPCRNNTTVVNSKDVERIEIKK